MYLEQARAETILLRGMIAESGQHLLTLQFNVCSLRIGSTASEPAEETRNAHTTTFCPPRDPLVARRCVGPRP